MLKKKLGRIGAGLLLSSFWRVAASSGITGLVAAWSWRLLYQVWPGGRLLSQVLGLVLAVLLATATYLAATYALRLPETGLIFRIVRQAGAKLRRRTRS